MKLVHSSPAGRSATKGRVFLIALGALAAALVLAGVAGAQFSGRYELSQYLLDSGGGLSATEGLAIESDVGQSIFGTSASDQTGIGSGYSPGVVPPPVVKEPRYNVYLPMVLKTP